jgi:hypothetical protein
LEGVEEPKRLGPCVITLHAVGERQRQAARVLSPETDKLLGETRHRPLADHKKTTV